MNINKKYILITLLLFLIELFIAVFIRDKFIRPFLGDVLVVMLLFSFTRIFYQGALKKIIIGVLFFSFLIEILQFFQFAEVIGFENNKIAKIILGSTFDWLDLLAYIIGAFLCIPLDKKINNLPNQQL